EIVAREHGGEQSERNEVSGQIEGLQLPFAARQKGVWILGEGQSSSPAGYCQHRDCDHEWARPARQEAIDRRSAFAFEGYGCELVLPAGDADIDRRRARLAQLGEAPTQPQVAVG